MKNINKKIYFCQIITQFLIFIIVKALKYKVPENYYYIMNFIFVCELILLYLSLNNLLPEKVTQLAYYLEVILSCYTLPESLNNLSFVVYDYHIINFNFWVFIVCIYSIFMFIPVTKLIFKKINNNWGKILLLTFCMYESIITAPEIILNQLHYSPELSTLINSGIIGTIGFILVTIIIFKDQKLSFLHFKISNNASKFIICLIILCQLSQYLYNIYETLSNWINPIDAWSYYLSNINLTTILAAFQAGIAEEWLMRFCILSLLLNILKKRNHLILLTIVLDTIIFSLFHILNIRTQPLTFTIWQMYSAISFGLVASAIYLYTDSLVIPIFFHITYDLIGFILTNNSLSLIKLSINTTVTFNNWIYSTINLIISIIIVTFLLTGNRKKTIELNIFSK